MTYELDGKKYKTQQEYRKALFNHTKYSNAYREWTDDLDTELVNLAKGMTIEELALHFKRKPSAIRIRLNKIDMKNYRIEQQIINGILDGCDPITGEMFQNQSCWKHPQILDDLKKWLADEVEE